MLTDGLHRSYSLHKCWFVLKVRIRYQAPVLILNVCSESTRLSLSGHALACGRKIAATLRAFRAANIIEAVLLTEGVREVCSRPGTLYRTEDANFQGSPLFQATKNAKTNNERNNLSAAGWEDSSSYLGCAHEFDVYV